MYVTE